MSKKYSTVVTQEGSQWVAEIVRRASARKNIVSKRQDGFASEAEAQAWAEQELKTFLKQLSAKNKARAEQRQ